MEHGGTALKLVSKMSDILLTILAHMVLSLSLFTQCEPRIKLQDTRPWKDSTRCSLNPDSPNYVEKRIGDKKIVWDYDQNRHRLEGYYPNSSKYVRIEMNDSIREGVINKRSLPFGFGGPIRPRSFSYFSGSHSFATSSNVYEPKGGSSAFYTSLAGADHAFTFVTGGTNLVYSLAKGGHNRISANGVGTTRIALNVGDYKDVGGTAITSFSGSWEFPTVQQRSSSADGGNPGKDAFFGVHCWKSSNSQLFDTGYPDLVRGLPFNTLISDRHDGLGSALPKGTEYPWVFSLDDVHVNKTTGADDGAFISGSRAAGTSETAASSSYKGILDYYNRFFVPMYGGADGFDVTEAEPFRNSAWTVGSTTELIHHSFNSVDRAIKTVQDAEVVESNLMVVPGITNDDLTDRLMDVCAEKSRLARDSRSQGCLQAIDLRIQILSRIIWALWLTTVQDIQTRDIDNSYACTYYPWVQVKDTRTDRFIWVPPSVVALGTFASSEAKSEVWFAPAGFTRGGLTEGSAGLPVIQVSERLTSKQRDSLYENNINPIAKFPAEGIVIFGQKTLQPAQSALDRINVRRLMIFVKKQVSRIAATILFDQNVPTTWARFTSQVNPFLSSVQSRLGITEFKVVLDETTTTPDLIDRNILYAKIYIKPARAIEFIAIDFIITRTGASFDD